MYGYVYITTNLINGKQYIGQHHSSKFNENYKGSGKIVCRAFNKYGFDNFKVELLEECNSKEELNEKEIYWINKYDAVRSNRFYNMAEGGSNGALKLAQEAARKPEVRAKAAPKIIESRRRNHNGDACPWFHTKEALKKSLETRKRIYEDIAHSLHTDDAKIKAKLARIEKFGSSTAFMMTKEVRDKVSLKVSTILELDDKEFLGYSSLHDYIKENYNIDMSYSAMQRLAKGILVIKYKEFLGRIKIIKKGSVLRNKENKN